MRLHPEEFHIQMAATACVYNLTKGDVGQKIHPHTLKEVVHFTLAAMENFPNHLQVTNCVKRAVYVLKLIIFILFNDWPKVAKKHAIDVV